MKKWLVVLLVLFIIPAFLFTVSCQKKVSAQSQLAKPSVVLTKPTIQPPATTAVVGAPAFMSEKIYFDFDKSVLTSASQDNLKKKAEWLKANPTKVMIEGNCDERGTNEYNMALGERRAESTKKYLVDLGVKAENLKTISYGEEKPVCKESTEACWSKNRNASFVVFK